MRAFANVSRGALFTEAGCRSYQAPYLGDAGSPLAVVRFLETLRARRAAGLSPYVPGAMLAWEIAYVYTPPPRTQTTRPK